MACGGGGVGWDKIERDVAENDEDEDTVKENTILER